MFPPPPPPEFRPVVKRKNMGLRVMAVAAAGLVVGFGLCTAAVMSGRSSGNVLGTMSMTVYALSAVALLVGLIWAIAAAISNSKER